MMMQIPIVTIQKTRFIRGRTLLNVSALRDNYMTVLMKCIERALLVFDDIWTCNGTSRALFGFISTTNQY
jgi:hypothetical protein